MRSMARLALWLQMAVLAVATLIFTRIGMRFVADPVQSSAERGVTLGSTLAAATTRVEGAFPLAIAAFCLWCLLSRKRLRTGVGFVVMVLAVAMSVRLFSVVADGAAPGSVRLFVPEGVILLLSVSGLALEAQTV